jgi:hypothetical protein
LIYFDSDVNERRFGMFVKRLGIHLRQGFGGHVDLGTHRRYGDYALSAYSAGLHIGSFGGRDCLILRSRGTLEAYVR